MQDPESKVDEHNTSLPNMHLVNNPPTHVGKIRKCATAAQLGGGSSDEERVPSSTNSLVSDSNYDSGMQTIEEEKKR